MLARCLAIQLAFVATSSVAIAQRRPPVNAGTDTGQNLRAPAEADEFSFVIFADRTDGRPEGVEILRDAVTMANRLGPAFAMTVGDMIQGYGDERAWFRQMREYKHAMGALDMPWYPVVGNHDVYERPNTADGHIGLYKEHFGPLYYSFDYLWAHFVCLFTDEDLSFSNPAVDQNMGREQIEWLRRDLAATDAEQIFVFLHHPRWNYEGCNWDDVHRILAEDGRVAAVIGGHVHVYRDDGVRDGIHYYTMAVTGGSKSGMNTASFDHINLVRARRDGFVMCALPVGSVLGGDVVLGAEVDAMREIARSRWIDVEGALAIDLRHPRESTVLVTINNPADRPLKYAIEPTMPEAWETDRTRRSGIVRPGATRRERIAVRIPQVQADIPRPMVRAALVYPLASGLEQPIITTVDVPVSLRGLDRDATRADPTRNRVLALDGKSAVRVDLTDSIANLRTFTLECWTRGKTPDVRSGLVTKTESSSFGIFWSDPGSHPRRPTGYVNIQGRGYVHVTAPRAWDYSTWTHVALVYDGLDLRLYVAGEPVAEAPAAGLITNNALPLYVGADPNRSGDPTSYFTGEIDEVHLTESVRYLQAFDPPRVIARDPSSRLLLHFDRDVHGIHPDDSGGENHGWSVGAPALRESRPLTR